MTDTYTPLLTDAEIFNCFDDQCSEIVLHFDADELYPVGRAIERAAIEAYQRQQWQPIETAPKDGTRIIVYRKPEPGYEWAIISVDRWHRDSWWRSRRAMQPIAWMPLPPPPEPTS